MLIIKPVADKQLQADYAEACGAPFHIGDLAYAAYDDGAFIALSQFRLSENGGILDTLSLCRGSADWEALFILARQTLNWIDLRGFHSCQCPPDAGDMRLLRLVGFESREDGGLCADMTHMFDGSCGGRCSLAEELKKLSNDASI